MYAHSENMVYLCPSKRQTKTLSEEMNITMVAGARPNFMKIAPLVRAITEAGGSLRCRLVYTGPEADASLEPTLFENLDMPRPDAFLGIESGDFFERMGGILVAFARDLEAHPADVVMVVDDTTPTMACSLAAKKKGIRVAHLVAGIRSFDMEMPKELNRMIIDGLSDWFFTAGRMANRNLDRTGAEQARVYFVGNLLMDTLRHNRRRFVRPAELDAWGVEEGRYALLTLNRRTLLADGAVLRPLFAALAGGTDGLPVVAPLHRYAQEALEAAGIAFPALRLMPPRPYLEFGHLVAHAAVIITDSGNVAEEATFWGIPCITLSRYAEHPETVTSGTNRLTGESPEELAAALTAWRSGSWPSGTLPERWDGRAAERIVQVLQELA